jgi:predicted oxidoreductase
MNVHQVIRKEFALSGASHFPQNVSPNQKLLACRLEDKLPQTLFEFHQAVCVLSSAFTV